MYRTWSQNGSKIHQKSIKNRCQNRGSKKSQTCEVWDSCGLIDFGPKISKMWKIANQKKLKKSIPEKCRKTMPKGSPKGPKRHPKVIKNRCENRSRNKTKKPLKIVFFGVAKSCQNVVRVIKNQGFADPRKGLEK